MTIEFHRAQRPKTKLRLAISGPTGSGKTCGALNLAFGLGGRVALIDTEGAGALYAQSGDYDICALPGPLSPPKYLEALRAAEAAGYNVVIIDSLRHFWPDPGPVLAALLQSRCHLIVTLRNPYEMEPLWQDELNCGCTAVLDLDQQHTASPAKDLTGLLAGQRLKLTPALGRQLRAWLETGVEESLEERSADGPGESTASGAADEAEERAAHKTADDSGESAGGGKTGGTEKPAQPQPDPAPAGGARVASGNQPEADPAPARALTKAAPTCKKRLF